MWSMSSVSPIVTRSTPLVAARMMSTSSSSDDTDHVQQQQQQQQDASSSITDTIIDNSNTASESFLSEVAVPKSTSFIWVPMEWIEAALTNVHELGAPWWLTIFGATFAVRTVLLPVMVMSVKNSAIMANLKPELEALKQKLTVSIKPTLSSNRGKQAGIDVLVLVLVLRTWRMICRVGTTWA